MATVEEELLADLASLANRPYDFVLWAFPWGEAETELENRTKLEPWQAQILLDLQHDLLEAQKTEAKCLAEAWQAAIRSGHDVGKTALLSWIILWGISTREDTRGRATANTRNQLETILWSELAKWHRLFIARDFFKHTATAYYSTTPARERTWRIDAIPWSDENPQAFAGLHNYGKRIILIFDEASGISDKIWEVVDGVTHEANTEIIWIAPGNPHKNYGRFRDCFSRFGESWHQYKVDSREVSFANQLKIAKAIKQWGEDSDYVKVRYLGEFPDVANTQLIPVETIRAAMARSSTATHFDSLVLGVDVARFGDNESVAVFRRGRDAKSIATERWRGLSVVETANRVAGLIQAHDPDAVFVDEGGVGGGVIDVLRSLGHSCLGVNFGIPASTRPNGTLVGNKRAEMYVMLRDWLREGGAIEEAEDLRAQLTAIEYFFNKRTQEIMLVSKDDMRAEGIASPDWADALAITFAYPTSQRRWRGQAQVKNDYDPLAPSALPNYRNPELGDPYRDWAQDSSSVH